MKNKKALIFVIAILSVSLIFVSVYFFVYPNYKINKYYKEEKKDIDSFLDKINNIKKIPEENEKTQETETLSDSQEKTSGNYNTVESEVKCVLYIPDISLEKAVYRGENDYNLSRYRLVEGLIDMTLGETCYMIFGHDSYNKGASFSRLAELNAGAKIFLKYEGGERQYMVSAIDSVLPEEVIYLIDYDNADALYLVTCEKKKLKGESDYRRRVLTCYLNK